MGIFSPIVKNAYEGFDSEITGNMTFEEAVLQDDSLAGVFDESMDLTECGLQAVIDINENYNMIEKALMGNELVYMEQTGQEYQYTEAICEGFIESIKNFLKKVWEKIKALFHRFMMKIDSYMKTDKEFVQKYKKDIYSGKDLSDFTFKGYKFTLEGIIPAIKKCSISQGHFVAKVLDHEKMKDNNLPININDDDRKKDSENFSTDADKWRADIANAARSGNGNSLDTGEFRKALFEAFRNGESEKEELDKINLGDYATELMTSKDTKKEANNAFKESDRIIKEDEKILNNISKEGYRNSPVKAESDSQKDKDDANNKQKLITARIADSNHYLKWIHLAAECLTTVNAEALRALNDRNRQYKACIIKAVAHKPSNESAYEESYTPTGGSSFLADLALR